METSQTLSTGTSFGDLPLDLQHLVFAYSAAPLRTCRASAGVGRSHHLIATWLLRSDKKYPLFSAARHHEWEACITMLNNQIRHRPADSAQALHRAVAKGHVQLVTKLLEAGAWAAWAWSREGCASRQHGDFSSDEVQDVGSLLHPVIEAAYQGHWAVCHLLVSEHQVPPRHTHQALYRAALQGHLGMMQLLFAADPAVSAPGLGSRSVLRAAAACGNLAAVQFLLDRGADANNTEGTPWAGTSSKPASFNSRVGWFTCPVVAAAVGGNPAVLQLLVDRGATLENCWHEALAQAAGGGHHKAVQWLLTEAVAALSSSPWLDKGHWDHLKHKQVHWTGLSTWQEQGLWVWTRHSSPLREAAARGHLSVVQLLLDCGHFCSCKGQALAAAAYHGYLSVMQLLIQHDADVNYGSANGKCGRPLQQAKEGKSIEAMQLLLQSGAIPSPS